MIVKNIGSKIISIGSTVLMPDGQMKVTADIASAPAIKAFARMGMVKVEDDEQEKAAKAAEKKAAEKKAADEAAKKKAEEEAAAKKKAEDDAAKKKAAEDAAKNAGK